jgi:hypothetical protein
VGIRRRRDGHAKVRHGFGVGGNGPIELIVGSADVQVAKVVGIVRILSIGKDEQIPRLDRDGTGLPVHLAVGHYRTENVKEHFFLTQAYTMNRRGPQL